ncbi:hypothetical protein ACI01nite_22910 [Acetobacter cibinongensis]|uniref:Outer membrane protein/adhesin family protein n=1 Tax=Acetobacter cibinongensis TaxID=146475 RepID=A0A0D6N6U2_9PROT|nr:Hint domain-containing protein [Acetobacter cibinongensis]GAN61405.1 outer membrane protein/adhesin family protein [Acetobacter cibinongensis]GBQ14147.1 hypothetical protein AA0482_0813 [Acetobacter cibinongensis NRIC 0482]GEL59689.1 hypothetical protein ACI01nite_22910 [Acetobacter cibinongensis]
MATWIGTHTTADKSWSNSANWTDLKGYQATEPTTYEAVTFNDDADVILPSSFSTSGQLTVNGNVTFEPTSGGSKITFGSASFGSGANLTLNAVTLDVPKYSSNTGVGTITLENGANLVSHNSGVIAPTVAFKQNTDSTGAVIGNTITIDFNGSTELQLPALQNLSTYDRIVVAGTNGTNVELSLKANADGKTYSLIETIPSWGNKTTVLSSNVTLAGKLTEKDFNFTTENGNTILTCFLTGSMIRTTRGDVAVEDVQVGDMVVAFEQGTPVERAVVWVGRKHAVVRSGLPDDEAGYPVRISQGALAENVPYKDMLVTPEHCLFLNGAFVPARMLVNGSNITYDYSLTSYDYYHVETERHSVIMADGALTESYLNTGNRNSFEQTGNAPTRLTRTLNWEEDAAARLEVRTDEVKPLFDAIAARANTIAARTRALTSDPELHLITETGALLRRVRTKGNMVSFVLPASVKSVRIVSRNGRPADTIGPFVDDRRTLGVLVGKVMVQDARNLQDVTSHLTTQTLHGWHGVEAAPMRWTNGNASLPLDMVSLTGLAHLTLEIVSAGPYLLDTETDTAEALRA